MFTRTLICTILSIACIENNALRLTVESSKPRVAALIAIHPPKFGYMFGFLQQFKQCDLAQEAMDVMLIFSNEETKNRFAFEAKKLDVTDQYASPLYSGIVAQALPEGAKAASWKKLDGLAQLLSRGNETGYEFAFLMDAELGLNDCAGFSTLLDRLRKKHSEGLWYGDVMFKGDSDNGKAMKRAACTLGAIGSEKEFLSEPPDAYTTCVGNPDTMKIIAHETHDFQVFPWWNDVPYVHIGTAHRMFQHWARMIIKSKQYNVIDTEETSDSKCKYCDVLKHAHPYLSRALGYSEKAFFHKPDSSESLSVPPTEISKNMGSTSDEPLASASTAFEHLIYQFYTVAEEGFHIVDLTTAMSKKASTTRANTQGGYAVRHGSSVNERFWGLPEEDRQYFLQTAQPLWLPCSDANIKTKPILFLYHFDRC